MDTPRRKRLRTSNSDVSNSNDTLEAITKYMIAKEKAIVPDAECDVFGKHVANEIRLVKNVGRRKRVQLQILQLIYDAQADDGAI